MPDFLDSQLSRVGETNSFTVDSKFSPIVFHVKTEPFSRMPVSEFCNFTLAAPSYQSGQVSA